MKEKVVFEEDELNGNTKEVKKSKKITRFLVGTTFLVISIVILVVILQRMKTDSKLYEALTSEFEVYTESRAYILNSEKTIDYKKDSTIITLAEEDKRIAVGDIIAMYKTKEYDTNTEKLSAMDKEINEKIAALPVTYSAEIIQVENEIDALIQKIKNTASFIEINEYKTKLNELAYKKAKIVASLTPSGVEILKLIENRDAFYKKINTSSDNIISTKSGVVVYKVDGLEGKYSKEDLTIEGIEKIKSDYDKANEQAFGIKIVDNFESFMIVEEEISKKDYMKEGSNYTIELLDKDESIKGTLYKIIEDSEKEKVKCVFRITNGVENLVELRIADVKVIWKRYTGFWINNASMFEEKDVSYVKILSLNEYIDIPVKVITELDDRKLVNNYSKSELQELEIERKRSLLLYDRVVKDISLLENK